MFVVVDNASNNVLGEFATSGEAEQQRIRVVDMSPTLADYIEVVDLDVAVAVRRRAQPA